MVVAREKGLMAFGESVETEIERDSSMEEIQKVNFFILWRLQNYGDKYDEVGEEDQSEVLENVRREVWRDCGLWVVRISKQYV